MRPFFRQLWGDGPVIALRMRLKVYGARRPAYESNYRLWIVGRMRIAVRVKPGGVRRRAVLLVSGPTSRDKVLEVDADEQRVSRQLAELLS